MPAKKHKGTAPKEGSKQQPDAKLLPLSWAIALIIVIIAVAGYWYAQSSGGEIPFIHRLTYSQEQAAEDLKKAQDVLSLMRMDDDYSDIPPAINLLRRAAEIHPPAQHKLATILKSGSVHGVPANPEEAYSLFLKAAEQNHAESMIEVAVALNNGVGVEKDRTAAFEWWKKAASAGNVVALGMVAECYENGFGVELDTEKAIEYYKKAADLKDDACAVRLAMLYLKGPEPEKAVKYLKESAERNFPRAMAEYGIMLVRGKLVKEDYESAIKYLKPASEKGEPMAGFYLGLMHDSDQDPSGNKISTGQKNKYSVRYDKKVALEYFKKAANMGATDAMVMLSHHYLDSNPEDSVYWLNRAADAGNTRAAYEIYEHSRNNMGKDMTKYFKLTKEEEIKYLSLAYQSKDERVKERVTTYLKAYEKQSKTK